MKMGGYYYFKIEDIEIDNSVIRLGERVGSRDLNLGSLVWSLRFIIRFRFLASRYLFVVVVYVK